MGITRTELAVTAPGDISLQTDPQLLARCQLHRLCSYWSVAVTAGRSLVIGPLQRSQWTILAIKTATIFRDIWSPVMQLWYWDNPNVSPDAATSLASRIVMTADCCIEEEIFLINLVHFKGSGDALDPLTFRPWQSVSACVTCDTVITAQALQAGKADIGDCTRAAVRSATNPTPRDSDCQHRGLHWHNHWIYH